MLPRTALRRAPASSLVFSPDATRLLLVGGDAVVVLDAATRQQQRRLDIPAVMAAALSPLGTFLVTFQRPSKDETGAGAACGGGGRNGGSPKAAAVCSRLPEACPAPAPVAATSLPSQQAACCACCRAALQHPTRRASCLVCSRPSLQPGATSRCGAWRAASAC